MGENKTATKGKQMKKEDIKVDTTIKFFNYQDSLNYVGTVLSINFPNILIGFKRLSLFPTRVFQLDQERIQSFQKNYINSSKEMSKFHYGVWILDREILSNLTSISNSSFDGAVCNFCSTPVPMATANQNDGSFKCYSCRSSNKIKKLF